MVKRYSLHYYHSDVMAEPEMYACDDGEYVKFSDYAALRQDIEAALAGATVQPSAALVELMSRAQPQDSHQLKAWRQANQPSAAPRCWIDAPSPGLCPKHGGFGLDEEHRAEVAAARATIPTSARK